MIKVVIDQKDVCYIYHINVVPRRIFMCYANVHFHVSVIFIPWVEITSTHDNFIQ